MVFGQILILQTIIQEESQNLIKILQRDVISKTLTFQPKLEASTKLKKKNSIGISGFGYEHKEKQPIHVSKKNVVKKNMLSYYCSYQTFQYIHV